MFSFGQVTSCWKQNQKIFWNDRVMAVWSHAIHRPSTHRPNFDPAYHNIVAAGVRSVFSRSGSYVGFFEGNSERAYVALCKSIDCHWALRKVYPPVAQLSFEKKNNHWPIEKSKNRQPWKERFLQEHATGKLRKGWQKMSELHYFKHSKVYKQGRPWWGCPVSNPDPDNTIGLLCEVLARETLVQTHRQF